jgi:predicted nucleic-acid-binding Zn-ribbon protein
MAYPCCPKCGHRHFATTEIEPTGTTFKHSAIHCSSCGAVVAVMDFYNLGTILKKIAKKLGINI